MSATAEALGLIAVAAARRGTVVDALIAGGAGRYLRTRTLRFSLNRLVTAALHVVEIVLLAGSLPTAGLLVAVAARHGSAILESAWWGGLEPYRRDIAALTSAGRLRSRDERVRRMRRLSLVVGAVLLLLAVFAFLVGAFAAFKGEAGGRGRFAVAAVFSGVLLLRLAIDAPLRAFHSTVQGLRRVWRPGWSFILPDALQLLALVATVPRLGPWAVPLAALVSMLAAQGATFHFTRRTWRALRLEPTRPRARRARIGDPDASPLLHAVGWAGSRAASLAVLTVLAAPARVEDFLVALCVFLAAPLLDAVVGQANLYYVDLGRLTVPRWHHLRQQLVVFMLGGAVIFAVASGGVALALAAIFAGPHFGDVAAPLALLFIVRAPLAVVSVARFTAGAPVSVIAGAIVMVATTAALAALSASTPAALCGGMIAGALVTGAWPGPRRRSVEMGATLLVELVGLSPLRMSALVGRLPFACVPLGERALIARLPSPAPSRAELVQRFGGFARDIVILPPGAPLASAPASWTARLTVTNQRPLREAFEALFPDGLCLDLRARTDAARALPRPVRARLLRAVDRFLDEGHPVEGGPVEVTASTSAGRVELIFVVPRRAPRRVRRAWAARVALDNALGAASASSPPQT